MVEAAGFRRGDVILVDLDPTRGSGIRKTRPRVVISPDELNDPLCTRIVAPMTTASHGYPVRVRCRFEDKMGYVVLEHLRASDRNPVARRIGGLPEATIPSTLAVLQRRFTPQVDRRSSRCRQLSP